MRLNKVMDDLELSQDNHNVYVELDGVIYDIVEIVDNSQGIILIAKTDDKEMR